MSQSNPFQPWKQNLSVIQSNQSDFYQNNIQKTTNEINCDSVMGSSAAAAGNNSNVSPFANYNNNASIMSSLQSTSHNISSDNYNLNKATVPNLIMNKINSAIGENKFFDMNFLNGGTSTSSTNADDEGGKMEEMISNAIGDHAKQQILKILENISYLKPPEKLLLYLRLPGGYPETDPLRQSQNPLGTRSEINHTINWVRSHLEVDPSVSIPKQDVYEDYVAYCTRSDIKPLSTADFGKVMKQVFPGIRPRRLGTRGNSRYCYAAMRKATKLDVPKLPELNNTKKYSEISNNDIINEDGSWKTIKNWAETLLGGAFETMQELASHITTNNLSSLANNTSRQLLKKKIMQREAKDRKNNKNSNESTIKRHRKKRRKTVSTSLITSTTESQQQQNSNTINDNVSGDSCSQSSLKNDDGIEDGVYDAESKNALKNLLIEASQLLPINLITSNTNSSLTNKSEQIVLKKNINNKNDKNININLRNIDENSVDGLIINNNNSNSNTTIHGTNLVCDNNGVLNGSEEQEQLQPHHAYSALKQQQTSTTTSLNLASDNNVNNINNNNNNNKISLHDAELQNIFCKKVRQAQQAKGRWLVTAESVIATPPANEPVTTTTKILELPQTTGKTSHPMVADDKPVQTSDGAKLPSARINPNKTLMMMPRIPPKRRSGGIGAYNAQRLKKQKAGTPTSTEAVLNAIRPSDLVVKKDDIRGEKCIIPRERFISICNMEKDALDSYLVAEDNSQEQEAELLQIFQQPEQQKSNASSVLDDTENTTNSALDNFQLYGECKQEKLSDVDEAAEGKLQQLRNLLEHNLQAPNKGLLASNGCEEKGGMSKMIETSVNNNEDHQLNLYPGSASASLAMLVQRHNMPTSSNTTFRNRSMPSTPANVGGAARKLNVDAPYGGSGQNSNSARTFVPIASPTANRHMLSNPIMKNQNNLFASPRATPVVRRMQRNFGGLQHNLPVLNMPQNNHCNGRKIPLIGAQNTAFSRPQQFKTEFPASAPPSPSPMMAQQCTYRYAANNQQFSPGANMMPMQQTHPHQHQPHQQQQLNMIDLSTLECRSQSVPLHCRSPTMFNQNTNFNYSSYSSANNSVSQTPVPSEYSDFNDTNLLDMFANQEMPNVKIESADVISELLDDDDDDGRSDFDYLTDMHSKINYNTSRSVPATPLPHFGNTNTTNNFDFNHSTSTKTSNYLYDASKSVPTTPIQHHQLTHAQRQSRFRFSPDMLSTRGDIINRDFLINGNSVDQSKLAAYYTSQQQEQQQNQSSASLVTIDPIVDKELTTISEDIDFSSDPMIGNDILNFK